MNTVEQQARIAKRHSIEFPQTPVWLYQYRDGYGFRFLPLSNSEPGVLIACFYKGQSISPKRAAKILSR